MSKKFNLSKLESDELNTIIQVTQIQEEILKSLQQRSENHIIKILKRCGFEPEAFARTKIQLQSGEITVEDKVEEKPKK